MGLEDRGGRKYEGLLVAGQEPLARKMGTRASSAEGNCRAEYLISERGGAPFVRPTAIDLARYNSGATNSIMEPEKWVGKSADDRWRKGLPMPGKRDWLTRDVLVVEAAAWVLCAVAIVSFAIWLSGAPDSVPVHYGPDGTPDRWGSPEELILVPFVIVVANALMSLILHFVDPKYWNRPATLGEGEESAWYLMSARVIVWIELEIVLFVLAMQTGSFLGSVGYALPLAGALIAAMALTIAVPLIRFRARRPKKDD